MRPSRRFAALVLILAALPPARVRPAEGVEGGEGYLFYQPVPHGSESQFNPISSFVNYAFDPLQMPRAFGHDAFRAQFEKVWGNLTHPGRAIGGRGGTKRFINRQVFPVDWNHLDESVEMIPNYALHLIGGGMVYRKNVEWFRHHRVPYARALSVLLGMGAEFVQEVLEKQTTKADDEVADFYFFRPAGMLLFSWDSFARFFSDTLDLVEWPYQPMLDPGLGDLTNVGENFAVRPRLFGGRSHRPFLFFGLTTLLGTSHRLRGDDWLSWGAGAALEYARHDQVEARPSVGLFFDRERSLLASLLLNSTENLSVRLNVHPGVIPAGHWSPGVFVGLRDDGDLAVGVSLRVVPVGLAGAVW